MLIRKCLDENCAHGLRARGLKFLLLFSEFQQCLRKKSILHDKCTHETEAVRNWDKKCTWNVFHMGSKVSSLDHTLQTVALESLISLAIILVHHYLAPIYMLNE